MLSFKDLVIKERPVKKLTERYVGLYKIKKVVSKNAVKLKLSISIRIHSVINVSRIGIYRELVKRQKVKKPKLVEVEEVEKQEIEKILNKRKVRGIDKYLVRQNGFMAENNTQEKEDDLENTKELVDKFEEKLEIEIR